MRDLIAELSRTRRATTAAKLHGSPAHVVELRRELRAPAGDVWDACTDPGRVRRWFLPLSGDLRPGGTFQLAGNAGGTIRACDPPRRLEVTWEYGEATPGLVALELTPAGEAVTGLLLRHTVPDDEQWAQFGPGAVGVGWDAPLIGLAALLDLQPGDAGQFTPGLLRRSAVAWGEAHRASGVSPDVAAAAAARTSGFYAPARRPGA